MRSATSAKTVAYVLTENIPSSASACQVFMEKTVEVWYLNLPVWLRMRHRRYLTPFSNVCEAAPISLFWALNGLNELPEVRFKFPFNLIGKLIMAFLTGQSWRVVKSWYTSGAQTKDFGAVSQKDLTRSLDPSLVQTRSKLVFFVCLFVCSFVYASCQISFVDLTLFDYIDQNPL